VMETSLVATCLAHLVESDRDFNAKDILGDPAWGFEGTATELKKKLEEIAPELSIDINSKDFPKEPNVLSKMINEIEHTLKEAGIEIGHDRKGRARIIKIRKLPSSSSSSSSDSAQAQENHAQSANHDGNDGNDDGLRSTIRNESVNPNGKPKYK